MGYRLWDDRDKREAFVMEQNLEQTMSLLSHTPAALNALLRDLPETWTS